MKLRFANRLAEPTTLSFPGLRASNAGAGVGGLTQERLKAGESADIRFVAPDAGFNLYLPHAGFSDAAQQGRGLFGPIIVEEAVKPDVDVDAAVVLSDWNVEADGQIRDDFSDPALGRGSGRRGRLVFANGAAAPLKLTARPGARVRLRLGSAATARLAIVAIDGAKALIVAVDGQPSEPFEPLNNQFPMGPGARFELMFDMPRDLSAGVRLDLRGGAGEADLPFVAIATEGEQVAARSGPRGLPANPLLPAEIALESARRCDFAISGGGSSPFAVNGVDFRRLVAEASLPPSARRADGVRARQQDRGRPGVAPLGACRPAPAFDGRRLGTLLARYHPHPARPHRSHRLRRRQSRANGRSNSAIPEHRAAGVGAWFQVS